MKCPHCSFDNRDDAAFCENCGEVFVAAGAAKVSVPSVVEVPPVVRVPDIAPASSKSAVRASVADLVDPVPDGPEVPDLSGFERLVDSSYVPPEAAQAGDTAEIPRINEEYVPRARSYAMGPTEKELRRRDRQQKKLAKKFTKMQEKEEARKAKELLRLGGMRSSQVAFAVGYNDPHYFSYLFKKTVGMTPSEYRRENENQPE